VQALPLAPSAGSPEILSAVTGEVFACFPYLARPFQLAGDNIDQAKQALQAAEERQVRRADQQAQEQREQSEEAARQAREPQNILRLAYARYIHIKECFEAREDYLSVYISDEEMKRAKEAVTTIESKLKAALPPGITTDQLWAQAADAREAQMPVVASFCQGNLRFLEQTYRQIAPEETRPKKDFP